jgi:hypothetical protein
MVVWATIRSDVIGDFHDPYGAALACGIRLAFLFYIQVIVNDAQPSAVAVKSKTLRQRAP